MLKVLEVLPDLGSGGAEKLVVDLMTNFDKSKIDVTLVTMFNEENKFYYKYLVDRGYKVICLNKKQGLDILLFYKFWKLIKQLKPDVIHTHLYVNLYLLPYYIFHKNQVAYHTVHNIAAKELPSNYIKIMNWLYHHRNVKPIAISQLIGKTIVEEYKISTDLITIYNGVNTEKYSLIKKETKNDCINFIAVGRLSLQKNYPLMINAFAEAYQQNQNISLTILGEGELRKDIEGLIDKLDMKQVITLKGNVTNVQDYLANADCFLMSSDYEGLPLSVLEAMSAGLPIISTKAGGIVDIVENNTNGLLVNLLDKDALTQAILTMTDRNLISKYGTKSTEMSKQYDIKNCVQRYEELFLG